jgi:hypothetical protein
MLHTVHIHEDDLELYNGGRLEPERILVVEWHLSICHACRGRLSQCIGVPLEGREPSRGTWERGWRVTRGTAA